MSVLFPPILESQRASIPSYKYVAGVNRPDFIIPVTLPMSVDPVKIRAGHIQVLVRRQIDMMEWCEPTTGYAPEKNVIYIEGTRLNANNNSITVPSNLLKPFLAGDLINDSVEKQTGRTYTIQVRFGDSPLWVDGKFADWKALQIANSLFGEWSNTQRMFCYGVPESGNIFEVTPINDVIGKLEWSYNPVSQDPISQVRLNYSWSVPDGYGNTFVAKNVGFTNSNGQTSGSTGIVNIEAIRFAEITITLRLTTINDTIFEWSGKLTSITDPINKDIFKVDPNAANRIQPYPIVGEELEDGVLATTFTGTYQRNDKINTTEDIYYNIYRVDVVTLETVLLASITGAIGTNFTETIRDYSVEMGAEYVYIAVSYGKISGKIHYILVPLTALTPATWNPPLYSGYGRQMNFNSNVFITTKYQQLRLQGNVSVSNLQRNTSDQITTTIGSPYPFYSRSADYNYRTFSMQGLISLNFDTTHTFLKFKSQQSQEVVNAKNRIADEYQIAMWALNQSPGGDYQQKVLALQNKYYSQLRMIYEGINPPPVPDGQPTELPIDWTTGQLWFVTNKDTNQIELRTPDLFSMDEYSLSRKRVRSRSNPKSEWIDSLDNKDGYIHTSPPMSPDKYIKQVDRMRGATTIYDEQMMQDITQITSSDRVNNLIYAERKFREAVMEWLSNGNPKLIRSETEGNMIVMLTGISFTPFDKSRKVYSLSATVTEIAEYNLNNLVSYGLVPVDFQPFYIPGIEYDFVPGSVDNNITTAY